MLVRSKSPPTLCRPRVRQIWQPVRQHRIPDVAPPRSQGRLPPTSPALSQRTTQASRAPAPAWGDAPCEQIKKLSLKQFSFELSVCSGVSPQTTGLSICKQSIGKQEDVRRRELVSRRRPGAEGS